MDSLPSFGAAQEAATGLHYATAGMTAALSQMTNDTLRAAKAQTALAAAAAGVKKALKNMVAGFDELHLATQDTALQSNRKGSGGGASKKPTQEPEEPWFLKWERALSGGFAPAVESWQTAFKSLKRAAEEAFSIVQTSALSLWENALAPLGTYLLHTFFPAVANAFSQAVAPVFAATATALLETLAQGFAAACRIAEDAVNTLLLPALRLVQTIFTDVFTSLQTVWAAYGAPLLEQAQAAFTTMFSLLETLYNTVLQPVLAKAMQALDTLWSVHLAPLWDNFLRLCANIAETVLALWNNVLQPLASFFLSVLGPVVATVCSGIVAVFGSVAGTVADTIAAVVDILRGLCQFLTGAFTADWTKAWGGLQSIFGGVWQALVSIVKGAVNAIIACVNAVVGGIAAAFNGVVGAINSLRFTVPSWVPGLGGKSLGFQLPGVNAVQIPLLAQGAVIPPNSAFMAILGDQTNGRNLEAPENLLRQIVREESAGMQSFTAQQPVQLALDGDVFYRAMMNINARRGTPVGGRFADVI